MSQKQLDRIEDMLTSLIRTVGSMREEQASMKEEQASMKEEQASMKKDISTIKEDQALMREEQTSIREDAKIRHQEAMKEVHFLKVDNDLLWEKYKEHDRQLGHLRKSI